MNVIEDMSVTFLLKQEKHEGNRRHERIFESNKKNMKVL